MYLLPPCGVSISAFEFYAKSYSFEKKYGTQFNWLKVLQNYFKLSGYFKHFPEKLIDFNTSRNTTLYFYFCSLKSANL